MPTRIVSDLEDQIEKLVREHLRRQRAAAGAAVERAFASALLREPSARRAPSGRRAPTEMDGLVDRLYAAVKAKPGETMTVFAAVLGETPRALGRPMFHLKRVGKVRSAGQRNMTRYFPLNVSKAA